MFQTLFLIDLGICAREAQGLKAEGPNCSICWRDWGGLGGLHKSLVEWEVGSQEIQFCFG